MSLEKVVFGFFVRVFGRPSVVNPFDCFGDHLRLTLRAEGLEVTVIERRHRRGGRRHGGGRRFGAVRPARASLDGAVGSVAGTDNDTTNLSLVAAARHINPSLFVAARQNGPAGGPLFAAMDVDALLVPTEVGRAPGLRAAVHPAAVALPALPGKGDAGAAELATAWRTWAVRSSRPSGRPG